MAYAVGRKGLRYLQVLSGYCSGCSVAKIPVCSRSNYTVDFRWSSFPKFYPTFSFVLFVSQVPESDLFWLVRCLSGMPKRVLSQSMIEIGMFWLENSQEITFEKNRAMTIWFLMCYWVAYIKSHAQKKTVNDYSSRRTRRILDTLLYFSQ